MREQVGAETLGSALLFSDLRQRFATEEGEQEEAKRFIERLDRCGSFGRRLRTNVRDYREREKVEVMRQRVQRGEPLFHPNDRRDFEGMVGGSVSTNGAKNEKRNRLFAWRFSR